MVDEDLKQIWHSAQQPQVVVDNDVLFSEMKKKLQGFDRQIKNRDMGELVAVMLVVPAFAVAIWQVPLPTLSKIGAALVIPWAILCIYILRSVKTYRVKDASLPFINYLKQYRLYISKEKWLLDTVLWWYILPVTVALFLFFLGLERWSGIAIMLGLHTWIYIINRQAVKKHFLPLLQQLEEQIEQLEQE